MQRIELNEKFVVAFEVYKRHEKQINSLLTENKYEFDSYQRTPLTWKFEVVCKIRTAEVLRQLIKSVETI